MFFPSSEGKDNLCDGRLLVLVEESLDYSFPNGLEYSGRTGHSQYDVEKPNGQGSGDFHTSLHRTLCFRVADMEREAVKVGGKLNSCQ